MNTITPNELHELHQRGTPIQLIDVRTPAEFREAHVPFAENRPLEALDCAALARTCRENPDAHVYVICQKGGRGATACRQLATAGLLGATNVEGGTAAWEAAGLPVVRGKKTISLERQVRIAAGSLVLLGCALAVLVHPYLLGLAAFVGAGLVFAGVTDTCGMGMVLARMPWNQLPATATLAAQPVCCKE